MEMIFIVGAPRSGTTLLQTLLMNNKSIVSFPETHLFEELELTSIKKRLLHRISYKLFLIYTIYIINKKYLHLKIKYIKYLRINTKIIISEFLKDIAEITNGIEDLNNSSMLLEKTPGHLFNILLIEKYFPQAKFIHIIRQGESVVTSLYKATNNFPTEWKGAKNIESCTNVWNLSLRESMKFLYEEKHILITYENLVIKDEHTIKNIFQFLDLEFKMTVYENFNKNAQKVISIKEKWKLNNKRQDLVDQGYSNFLETFTDIEQNNIKNKLFLTKYKNLLELL